MVVDSVGRKNVVKSVLRKKFKYAWQGRKTFLHVYKKNRGLEKTAYILFPEDDDELNFYGLLYLDDLSDFSSYENFVIITSCKIISQSAKYFCNKIKNIYEVSKDESDRLLAYYSLYKFYKNLLCVSIDMPDARRGSNILGKNNVSKEQLVGIGIYHIMPFRKDERIISYNGDNPLIKEFLDRKH